MYITLLVCLKREHFPLLMMSEAQNVFAQINLDYVLCMISFICIENLFLLCSCQGSSHSPSQKCYCTQESTLLYCVNRNHFPLFMPKEALCWLVPMGGLCFICGKVEHLAVLLMRHCTHNFYSIQNTTHKSFWYILEYHFIINMESSILQGINVVKRAVR